MLHSIPKRDSDYLGKLREYYAQHGTLPSYAGLSQVIGFRAKTSAVKLAERLQTAGFLQAAPGGKLAPTKQFFGLPLLSVSVRAGVPEGQDEDTAVEQVSLDALLIEDPLRTVLIPVKGDSMKDAGIVEGDIAVVERTSKANHGDLVVALVDDEYTLKELFFKDGKAKLLPRNARYEPIEPTERLEIFGVVRGLVRRYQSQKTARKR